MAPKKKVLWEALVAQKYNMPSLKCAFCVKKVLVEIKSGRCFMFMTY